LYAIIKNLTSLVTKALNIKADRCLAVETGARHSAENQWAERQWAEFFLQKYQWAE